MENYKQASHILSAVAELLVTAVNMNSGARRKALSPFLPGCIEIYSTSTSTWGSALRNQTHVASVMLGQFMWKHTNSELTRLFVP